MSKKSESEHDKYVREDILGPVRPKDKDEKDLSDVERVKLAAANPHASRAGVVHEIDSTESPLKVTVYDGARALIEVKDHERLTQAELQSAVKVLKQAVQETT